MVTSKPTSILVGHKAGLNDVKIRSDKRLIFSYDKVAVLKAWDIDSSNCMQTINLHFPRLAVVSIVNDIDIVINFFNCSFDVLGKEIEFGRPALYVDTASLHLIIVST